ncbi:MAG: hypothetical protein V3V75_01965, partial [Thermoguttaceae bacterium]
TKLRHNTAKLRRDTAKLRHDTAVDRTDADRSGYVFWIGLPGDRRGSRDRWQRNSWQHWDCKSAREPRLSDGRRARIGVWKPGSIDAVRRRDWQLSDHGRYSKRNWIWSRHDALSRRYLSGNVRRAVQRCADDGRTECRD